MTSPLRPILVVLALAAASLGCGEEPSEYCAEQAAANAPCSNDASEQQCEDANAACPGRVTVAESCPVQYFCP